MHTIDMDQFDAIEQSFSTAERRQINTFIRALERWGTACEAAFAACGAPAGQELTTIHTWFFAAIEPDRLRAAEPHIAYMRACFDAELRKTPTARAQRALSRAVRACDEAIDAIRRRLAEIEPIVKEQERLIDRLEYLVTRLSAAQKEATMRTATTDNKVATDATVVRTTARLIELSSGAVLNREDVVSDTEVKAGDRIRRTGTNWTRTETK